MKSASSRGFIEIILLVVIALVIIFLVGLEPSDLWSEWIKPLFLKLWDVLVAISKAIALAIKSAI